MGKKTLKDYMSPQGWKALQDEKAQRIIESVPVLIHSAAYTKFQQRYRDDRIALIYDCIDWREGEKPTEYQAEIIAGFQTYDRIAVRGPRGLGKTAMGAWDLLSWALVYDGEDWKVGTTASAWRQLEEFLWPEIHKWAGRLRWDKIGRDPYNLRTELMTLRLVGQNKARATAIASDDPETIEGLHAKYLKVIFDESKIIQDQTWDSLEGSFSNADPLNGDVAEVLAISTPGEPAGRFYDIHKRAPGYEDWHTRHITMKEAIAAGRLSATWVEQRRKQWGEDSALFQNQVMGEFAAHDEDVIIPLAWVEQANSRWDDWQDRLKEGAPRGQVTSIGLDVALGQDNNDLPIFTLVYDETNLELETFVPKSNDTATMEIAGRAAALLNRYNCDMYIDVIGLGVGVYNRLRELGYKNAHAFNASGKVSEKIKDSSGEFTFRNNRAAMWHLGREMLDPLTDSKIAIPRDSNLIGELTRTRYKPLLSRGVIQVEAKRDIRARLGRSTDRADSVLQALLGGKLVKRSRTRLYLVGVGYVD